MRLLRYSSGIVITIFFLFSNISSNFAYAEIIVNDIESGTIQLKEHDYYASAPANEPNVVFDNSSGTFLYWKNDATTPPTGEGIVFIVFQASEINDKVIEFTFQKGQGGANPNHLFEVRIYDGSYLRSNATQFPDKAAILTEGNGLLQTGYTTLANFGVWTTRNFTVNIVPQFEYVTVMFYMRDSHLDIWTFMLLTDFKILKLTGETLYEENMHCDLLTMEVVGGDNDYGYCDSDIGNPPIAPIVEGYIGGTINNSYSVYSKRISYIYIANVEKSITITETIFNIFNYTNEFGDTWVSIVLYSTSNLQPISSVNPLKAIWQNTTLIHNGTFNQLITYYPRIVTLDNQYVAIAFSSTEHITINGSSTEQIMYNYSVFAPYSIEYLSNTNDRMGVRFKWNLIIPPFYPTFTPTVYQNTWDIPNNLNAIFVQIGISPILIYGIMFIMTIFSVIIIITNAKNDNLKSVSTIPTVIIGIFSFSILAFFAVSNMLPYEMLIFSVVGVVGIFTLFIVKIILGGDE